MNVLAPGFPMSQQINCFTGDIFGLLDSTYSRRGLTYKSSTDNYTWNMDPSWQHSCRRLVVRFNDGTEAILLFLIGNLGIFDHMYLKIQGCWFNKHTFYQSLKEGDHRMIDYLLAGPGTEHIPTIEYHTLVLFPEEPGADAVYIAPAHFIDELVPLVTLRQHQGYAVQVVDVADIYDAWSYGAVSPDAIRNFLRFAKKRWNPGPIAAVLMGDGTIDPHNYLGRLDGDFNRNIIPSYLAFVDPWSGILARLLLCSWVMAR